jgi:hypothetical protein
MLLRWACLQVQAVDEVGGAERARQVILVAQHQQRDACASKQEAETLSL